MQKRVRPNAIAASRQKVRRNRETRRASGSCPGATPSLRGVLVAKVSMTSMMSSARPRPLRESTVKFASTVELIRKRHRAKTLALTFVRSWPGPRRTPARRVNLDATSAIWRREPRDIFGRSGAIEVLAHGGVRHEDVCDQWKAPSGDLDLRRVAVKRRRRPAMHATSSDHGGRDLEDDGGHVPSGEEILPVLKRLADETLPFSKNAVRNSPRATASPANRSGARPAKALTPDAAFDDAGPYGLRR